MMSQEKGHLNIPQGLFTEMIQKEKLSQDEGHLFLLHELCSPVRLHDLLIAI